MKVVCGAPELHESAYSESVDYDGKSFLREKGVVVSTDASGRRRTLACMGREHAVKKIAADGKV